MAGLRMTRHYHVHSDEQFVWVITEATEKNSNTNHLRPSCSQIQLHLYRTFQHFDGITSERGSMSQHYYTLAFMINKVKCASPGGANIYFWIKIWIWRFDDGNSGRDPYVLSQYLEVGGSRPLRIDSIPRGRELILDQSMLNCFILFCAFAHVAPHLLDLSFDLLVIFF